MIEDPSESANNNSPWKEQPGIKNLDDWSNVKPKGPIESVELDEEEEKLLESKCEHWFSVINTLSIEAKIVLSQPHIFAVLIGLVPEKSYESSRKGKAIKVLYELIQQEEFGGKFVLIKSDKNQFSFINLEAAKKALKGVLENRPLLRGIDFDGNAQSFIESFIEVFNQTSGADREFIYGVLSGFPLSSVNNWIETNGNYSYLGSYSLVEQSDVEALEGELTTQRYEWNMEMPTYFTHKISRWEKFFHKLLGFKRVAHGTIPMGSDYGFTISEDGASKKDLVYFTTKINFVFLTLGISEELKNLYKSEVKKYKANQSAKQTTTSSPPDNE